MLPINHGNLDDETQLDALFSALADPTRRALLRQLKAGPSTVKELTAPFEMSQPAVSKHLKVLEGAGLITRQADAQRRLANLNAAPMEYLTSWLNDFSQFWPNRMDALADTLDDLQDNQNPEERKNNE